MHTIKGTCGFLGLPRLEALAHAGETLMGKFRDGMPVRAEAVTLILSSIDRIKEILAGLEATEAELTGANGADSKPRVQARAAARRPAAKSSTRLGSDKSKSVSTKHYIGAPLSGQVGRRAADPTDGVADGTESDGFTRRVRETPFGAQHWWEKKQQ